jgi:hypothetical protein
MISSFFHLTFILKQRYCDRSQDMDKHNMIFEDTNIYLFHSINSLATNSLS